MKRAGLSRVRQRLFLHRLVLGGSECVLAVDAVSELGFD